MDINSNTKRAKTFVLNYGINDDIIDYTTTLYKQQIDEMFGTASNSLIKIISFCIFNNIPSLLSHLMDCYSRDHAQCAISLIHWIDNNNFFNTIKNKSDHWYNLWKCCFIVYMNRTIPKFNIRSIMVQVDDDFNSILDFVTSTHIFSYHDYYSDIGAWYGTNYPSQFDIAVTIQAIKYLKYDDDDSISDDNSEIIHHIKSKYWRIDDKYKNTFIQRVDENLHTVHDKYQSQLRNMYGYNYGVNGYRNKRICVLIDRRSKEIIWNEMIVYGYIRSFESMVKYWIPNEIYNLCYIMTFNDNGIEQNKNEARITIFEPPMYNTIPTNSVTEWNHYSSQKCIIPTNRGNITSLNCTDYGIINFSLHVMEEDCVKCYVHWNGQTIRVFSEVMCNMLC